eukprot:2096017-Prymnesium_polylepis.1
MSHLSARVRSVCARDAGGLGSGTGAPMGGGMAPPHPPTPGAKVDPCADIERSSSVLQDAEEEGRVGEARDGAAEERPDGALFDGRSGGRPHAEALRPGRVGVHLQERAAPVRQPQRRGARSSDEGGGGRVEEE